MDMLFKNAFLLRVDRLLKDVCRRRRDGRAEVLGLAVQGTPVAHDRNSSDVGPGRGNIIHLETKATVGLNQKVVE